MKREEFEYLSADGLTMIHAVAWVPDQAPRAVLQICHGMTEYMGRYEAFAAYLAERGFYVTGNDHLGHGGSVRSGIGEDVYGFFAEGDGNLCVISDIHTLRQKTEERFPGLPYFFLGHSMGSFLLRQYITRYGAGLSGAVIMGTGSTPVPVLKAGMLLCRIIAFFKGWHYRSRLVDNMAGGSFTKRIRPLRTPKDWLTKDEAVVDRYLADPLCMFKFTLNAYFNMFRGMERMQEEQAVADIPRTLPLLLVAGEEDPVGNYGVGVRQAFEAYRKAGISRISMKLYVGDRHELLNETDRETVYKDLLAWLEAQLKDAQQARADS